ncbi:MAG: DUF1049 domain-containing protein [Chitinivibrionales bacterium]|nr:DUF1049 domain-containing protein [Chitinivibrionales bacterium]
MRFLKAAVFFAVSFIVAWVIIFTFIQPPFHQAVPAKLLWYQTDPYPIYYYLVGALVVGLAIGIAVSAYYYITLSSELRKARRKARHAEEELAAMRGREPEPAQADEAAPRAEQPKDQAQAPAPVQPATVETDGGDDAVLFEVKPSGTDDEPKEEQEDRSQEEKRRHGHGEAENA